MIAWSIHFIALINNTSQTHTYCTTWPIYLNTYNPLLQSPFAGLKRLKKWLPKWRFLIIVWGLTANVTFDYELQYEEVRGKIRADYYMYVTFQFNKNKYTQTFSSITLLDVDIPLLSIQTLAPQRWNSQPALGVPLTCVYSHSPV